jgi:hypothetical protein
VTLVRLALGFLAVAALFVGVGWARGLRNRRSAVALAGEALPLTLLGALWFASLGKGGWVLVFALLGVLAAGSDGWLAAAGGPVAVRRQVATTLITTIRYIIAGGLLFLIIS